MTALTERLQRLYDKGAPERDDATRYIALNALRDAIPEVIAALEACERDRQEWIEIPRVEGE